MAEATPELKHPKNQKQLKPENNREIKTIAFGSRYLTDSEKKLLNRRPRITGGCLGFRNIPILLVRKESFSLHRPPST